MSPTLTSLKFEMPTPHSNPVRTSLASSLKRFKASIELKPLDTIQIFGRYDFENPPTVSVLGLDDEDRRRSAHMMSVWPPWAISLGRASPWARRVFIVA